MKIDLGRYVSTRQRADGSYRVLFEVPPRQRPEGWPATITLPILSPRTGNLSDPEEVRRIRADAEKLYADYVAQRDGETCQAPKRTLAELVRFWQNSSSFKRITPGMKQSYHWRTGIVLAWAKASGEPDPSHLTTGQIEAFLGLYDDRPFQKYQLRNVLNQLMKHAIQERWRSDNPVKGIRASLPESEVNLWEQSDVDYYAALFERVGYPSVAAMILVNWEIGQRPSDLYRFKHGKEYVDGAFRFWQSKTRQYVTIPVPDHTRALIERIRRSDTDYLFPDGNGEPYTVPRISELFKRVRDAHPWPDGKRLRFRALRHSCIVQLGRAECSVPEIASISGHSLGTVHQILQHYLPKDNQLAWNAIEKRRQMRESKVLDQHAGAV